MYVPDFGVALTSSFSRLMRGGVRVQQRAKRGQDSDHIRLVRICTSAGHDATPLKSSVLQHSVRTEDLSSSLPCKLTTKIRSKELELAFHASEWSCRLGANQTFLRNSSDVLSTLSEEPSDREPATVLCSVN